MGRWPAGDPKVPSQSSRVLIIKLLILVLSFWDFLGIILIPDYNHGRSGAWRRTARTYAYMTCDT